MAVAVLPFAPMRAMHRREARRRLLDSTSLGVVDVVRDQGRFWTGTVEFADFTLRSEVTAWTEFLSELQPDGSDRGSFWAPLYSPNWRQSDSDWFDVIPLADADGAVSRFAISSGSMGPATGAAIEFRDKASPELSQTSVVHTIGSLLEPNLILERTTGTVEANWKSPRVRAIVINEDPLTLSQTSRHRAHPATIQWVEDRGALLELTATPGAGAVPRGDPDFGFNLCAQNGEPILTQSGENIVV